MAPLPGAGVCHPFQEQMYDTPTRLQGLFSYLYIIIHCTIYISLLYHIPYLRPIILIYIYQMTSVYLFGPARESWSPESRHSWRNVIVSSWLLLLAASRLCAVFRGIWRSITTNTQTNITDFNIALHITYLDHYQIHWFV